MGFNMKPKSPLTKKLVSALKHKPWAAAHKERPAHSGTAEAHNAEPAAPTKKYVSDAQRKAVHASKAEQSPAKLKKPDPSKTRIGPGYADKIKRDRERREANRKERMQQLAKRKNIRLKHIKTPMEKAEKKTQ